jgi:predicted O-methyltransferase YrrM
MKGTSLTDEIVDYMTGLFPVEDELLEQLKDDALEAGIPDIQISPEQGAFMQVLLQAIGARRVLEVGTLGGYSAIIMGRALPEDGELITIERDPWHAEFASKQIEKAGLQNRVKVHIGSAVDLLEGELANSGPYDFAFIDADKPSYSRYLALIYPMMRLGGLIAGDNAIAWGHIADSTNDDPDVLGMQEFNRTMAEHPGLQSCIVPIGDGMCLGIVK